MQKTELKVEGMTCGGCENTLSQAVRKLPGVTEVSADHATGQVVVVHDEASTGVEAIKETIEFAGYDVVG